MAYAYKQIEAHDPSNPGLVAPNASVTIFEPGDPAMTPLTLTRITGEPLANPVTVNGLGYGPAFMHATLPQVAWSGGGLTGTFESYEGMRDEAIAARTAAETAAANAAVEAAAAIGDATVAAEAAADAADASALAAANSAALVGAPADNAIATAINATGSATKTALSATIATGADEVTRKAINALSAMPNFVRANGGNPVFTQATQNPAAGALAPTTASSIYWPCIIRAADFAVPSPLDAFYMFYTTDHQVGGVWLATGPTPLGPWTGRGQVYNDTAGGEQTETAEVIMNPRYGEAGEKRFLMLYQQKAAPGAVGAQSTVWAASDDMLTWTRGAIAIDITPSVPGDGHTGYARVHKFGNQLYAHHLRGGGDHAHFGLSTSSDGKKWSTVSWLGWGQDQTGDGRRIEWNYTSLVRWRGQVLWIGMISQVVSGTATNDARIGIAPITPDLRTLVGRPQYILYPTVGAETTSYRGVHAYEFDGTIYLYYQVGNSFYAAIAED